MAQIDLDSLTQLHARSCDRADGYASSTHAGVGNVLMELAHQARLLAAESLEHYDNRLLYLFASRLEQAGRPASSKRRR